MRQGRQGRKRRFLGQVGKEALVKVRTGITWERQGVPAGNVTTAMLLSREGAVQRAPGAAACLANTENSRHSKPMRTSSSSPPSSINQRKKKKEAVIKIFNHSIHCINFFVFVFVFVFFIYSPRVIEWWRER